jgi:hypothetical protein
MRVALSVFFAATAFADSSLAGVSNLEVACPRATCKETALTVNGPGPIGAARLLETVTHEPAHGHDGGTATVQHLRLALKRGSRWFITAQLFTLRDNPGGHSESQKLARARLEQGPTGASWKWEITTDWENGCAGMSGDTHEQWELAIRLEGGTLATEAPRLVDRKESSHYIMDE